MTSGVLNTTDDGVARWADRTEWTRAQERWRSLRERVAELYSCSDISPGPNRRHFIRRCVTEAEGLLNLAAEALRREGVPIR